VGGGPAAEACVATLTIASSDSYAIQKHNAASGSSAISASTSAHVSSLPRFAVITSNHASQSRVVPAIAAKSGSRGERLANAINVAASAITSKTSKPAQAMSQ
jgi:hypothetical protein